MTQPPRNDDSEPLESADRPGEWQPPAGEGEHPQPQHERPQEGPTGQPPPGYAPYPGQQAPGQPPPGPPYGQGPPYGPPPAGHYQPQSAYGAQHGGTGTPAPPLGGSGPRFLARLLDGLIVFLLTLLVGAPLIADYVGDIQNSFAQNQSFDGQLSLTGISAGVYFLYDWLLHAFWNGQTVGKRALGIRVANLETGHSPSAGQQAGRSAIFALPALVPCCGNIFWLVNVLWHIWDKPFQQCLHDKPTRTVVVATR